MKTSDDGKDLMHHYERCVLHAYPDPGTGGDPWTIGWGDTGPDVHPGLTITQQEADDRFANRLSQEFEPGVEAAIHGEATSKQFAAMVALAYNIGLGNFRSSSVLRNHNARNEQAAADSFRLWNKAGGRVMKGLQRRREAERLVYLGADAGSAIVEAEGIYP